MHDCSNDDSGLPLAKLKTERRWTSAAAREAWDVTLVTQLSPSRRALSCPKPQTLTSTPTAGQPFILILTPTPRSKVMPVRLPACICISLDEASCRAPT